MKTVSSLKNPAVQAARALRDARERARQGAFLLDGEHMVGEALAACPDRVSALFVDEARLEAYAALTALVPQTACYAVPSHVLAAISQVKTPQGVAAVCAMPPSPAPEEMGNRLILLENVQDPGNVGTVLRTLDAAGFDGCILTPGCADPFGPKALRATMGSVFRVPVCSVGGNRTGPQRAGLCHPCGGIGRRELLPPRASARTPVRAYRQRGRRAHKAGAGRVHEPLPPSHAWRRGIAQCRCGRRRHDV